MGMLGSEFAAGTGLATARDSSTRRTLPIHYLNATKLAALIRTKESSSREAVRAHPGRINAVDPRVNAIVALTADDAPKVADAADKAVAGGETLGPLHGVPLTIKDALDSAGVLTQRGSKLLAGNIPHKDATAVSRFKAAGEIALVKTNIPEFSAWTQTDNLVTGRTNNTDRMKKSRRTNGRGQIANPDRESLCLLSFVLCNCLFSSA